MYQFLIDPSESCTCSQDAEGVYWAASFSDIPAYALSRSTPTAEKSSSNGNGTESCHDSQSGKTFELLTGDRGEEGSMPFAEGFRARESVAREMEQDLSMQKAVSGEKCSAWFAKWDRASSSWKTRHLSLFEDWEPFSGAFPLSLHTLVS